MDIESHEDKGVISSCKQGNAFSEIKKDKLLLSLFLILILLGIAVRFVYPTEPGLWNDDMSTVPTAVMWFYPHDYYPGLSAQGEPALSNYIIGKSCMLSGQDFSNVSKINPVWFPDRAVLLGKAMSLSEDYCRIPMYIFGLLFLIVITILSFMLLDKYSALYTISFFSFYPSVLQLSRWIRGDIILYTFLVLGLIFLWKFYISPKYSKREIVFFIISMAWFALSLGTKLPAAVYALFAFLVMLEKYKEVIFLGIEKAKGWLGLTFKTNFGSNEKPRPFRVFVLAVSSLVAYILMLLPPYEFDLKNIWLVIQMYRRTAGSMGEFTLNLDIGSTFYEFVLNINVIDIFLLLGAIYIFIALLLKTKDKNEKFIFMLILLFIFMSMIFPTISLLRIFTSFAFGLIFLMSLVLSSKHYSLSGILKLNSKTTRRLYLIILVIYIFISAYITFSSSPYFLHQNSIICAITDCVPLGYGDYAGSQAGEYASNLLKNNSEDTFEILERNQLIYYYAMSEQHYLAWAFRESFKQQTGRARNIQNILTYYHPYNRTVRYLFIDPNYNYPSEYGYPDESRDYIEALKLDYIPNDKIVLKHGFEAFWVYDLKNLQKRI
ncbi:MAG: phospholipid carrier-dependent glycosyltransferase [Candidatus Nanoarchaeia archaeon]|jgi:hypothetical protein